MQTNFVWMATLPVIICGIRAKYYEIKMPMRWADHSVDWYGRHLVIVILTILYFFCTSREWWNHMQILTHNLCIFTFFTLICFIYFGFKKKSRRGTTCTKYTIGVVMGDARYFLLEWKNPYMFTLPLYKKSTALMFVCWFWPLLVSILFLLHLREPRMLFMRPYDNTRKCAQYGMANGEFGHFVPSHTQIFIYATEIFIRWRWNENQA